MAQRQTEDAAYRLRIVGSESRVETADEFEHSYFREEYKSILRAVWRVIESTRLDRERRESDEYYNRYSPDIRVHNIVPIIGRRGSGKSSILHSVAGILQNGIRLDSGSDSWLREYSSESGKFAGIRFFVTESIDGSLLEHNEDIFPTILVQMKKMLPYASVSGREDREHTEGQYGGSRYQLRELNKDLEKLYENARQMEANANESYHRDEMTPLSSMNQLSNSLRLRQDFRKLLMNFLDYCAVSQQSLFPTFGRDRQELYSRENCYLIIPIDDLDLNILHGYEMLEKLHRYMMLPNVIVLLAFDQEQFKRLCENEFYKMIPKFDSRMNAAAPKIEELARQYLEKVMPLSQRTYVPSLDIRSEVKVKLEDESLPYTRTGMRADSDEGFLPRHLVFRLLFDKLGMRMDTDGEKRHFFERRTLRNYVNLVNLLDRMDFPFRDKSGKASFREDVYRHNHRVFRQEITQGMVTAWLSDAVVLSQYRVDSATTTSTYTHHNISPKEQFDQITQALNPIPRAFRNFFFSVVREGRQAKVGSTLHDLANSLDFYGFSYGEILHIIYHYGRISNVNKRLVHSLLAYYSLVLNRRYLDLRKKKGDQSDYTSDRKEFLQLMNGSVAGSWANSMVPVVWLSDFYYGSGLRVVNDMSRAFSFTSQDIISRFKNSELEGKDKIGAFFRAVLMIGMLFDRPNYKLPELFDFNYIERIKNSDRSDIDNQLAKNQKPDGDSVGAKSNTKEPNSQPSFQPVKGKGTFSFLNFVSTAFQYNDYLEKLLDYTAEYVTNNSNLFSLQKKGDLEKRIEEVKKSIKDEFQKWDENYFGFALPLYDIDVCYNLIKRLLQDRYGKPDYIGNGGSIIPTSNVTTLFDSYLEIYQSVANQLHSNDKVYLSGCRVSLGAGCPRPLYADAFCECPFIKWLDIQPEERALQSQRTQSKETIFTIELTKHLLHKVFEYMTLRSGNAQRISESHEDKNNYTRTVSYDE